MLNLNENKLKKEIKNISNDHNIKVLFRSENNDVWSKTVTTISALFRSSETGVGAKDLSGPVGIISMLSIFVNTDYRLALSFLVLLNINLAIINLLPVPVLDGGHIVMSIIEKIRNKPISVRIQEYATTVFAVMLLSFMVYVTFFDFKIYRFTATPVPPFSMIFFEFF